jgi:hypothetical protein
MSSARQNLTVGNRNIVAVVIVDKFYLLTSVFVEYDERVEVGGKAS